MSDNTPNQQLAVKLPVNSLEELAKAYGRLFSASGFYLPTGQLRPLGTYLPFKLLTPGGAELLSGIGKVVWSKSAAEAGSGFFGLGLNYCQFSPEMLEKLEKILELAGIPGKPKIVPIPAPGSAAKTQVAKSSSNLVLGIDLGTTNSACAVVNDNVPMLITHNGSTTIPSIVAIDESGKILVGHEAKIQMVKNPATAVYASKRLIGRNFYSPTVQTMRKRVHYEVFSSPEGECWVRIAGKEFSLVQISSLILSELRRVAEEYLKTKVERCVISVPAYYNEAQRRAVRQAGELSGMEVVRIVSEPTAAAMAYGHKLPADKRLLVYDIGGGTFDASLLDLSGSLYEVEATGGDNFLGGTDFDNRILESALDYLNKKYRLDLSGQTTAMQRLKLACEAAKCLLSDITQTDISLPYLTTYKNERFDFKMPFKREELYALTGDLVDATISVCDRVLKAAGRTTDDIDSILLVGGQSRYPLIHEKLRERFGKNPDTHINPDEAVAIGAALLGDSVDRFDSVVLIDVLPMALGVATTGGKFQSVIPAHAKMPISGEYRVKTGSASTEMAIFQGDSPIALQNEYLGTVQIAGLSPGNHEITLRFNFNENGQLELTYLVDGQNERPIKMVPSDTPDTLTKKLNIAPDMQPKAPAAEATKDSFFVRLFKR